MPAAADAPTSALAKSVLAWLQAPATSAAVQDDAKRAELTKAANALAAAFDLDAAASATPAGPGLAQIYDIFLRTQSKLSGGAPAAAASTAATAAAASTSSASATPAAAAAAADASKPVSAADKEKAEQRKNEGNKAMSAKDYGGAIAAYNEAIELDPANPVYYSNRAAAYSQIQQHDKAIEDATKAKELDPSFARAYSRLGHALFSAGRYQEAVEAYEAGLAIDPANAVMKNGLEASRKQVSPSGGASSSSSGADAVSRDGGLPGAGPGGLGGFPGFGGDSGPSQAGMPDLGALLNNPQLMQMASSLMANGGLEQLMNNPMLRNLMSDPNMQQMARNLMGGAGRGGGAGGPGANMFS